jgi:hypothetical protein
MKASLFFFAALLPSAFAATITLHNTGVNSSDVLVATGAQASFWSLSAEPSGATEAIGSLPFRYHNSAYFADTPSAAWVSPGSDGNAGALGFYTYDLVFNLANPATASISGTFGTDNDGSISLNNNAPVATQGFSGFGAPTAFAFTSGFVAGSNTIHVKVNNGGDPTAFFVQLASVGDGTVPEPGTVALTCAGLLGLLLVRRRIAQP